MASQEDIARDTRRLRHWITVAGSLLIALIVGADSYEAWQDYRDTVAQNERTQIAFSRAIAEQTARMFQEIDVVLSDYSDWRSSAEGMTADAQSVRERLHIDVARLPFIHSMTIVNARGELFATTRDSTLTDLNSGDPDFLDRLAHATDDNLYVGKPLLLDRYLTFAVARKVRGPDGAYAGAIIARMAFEYLTDFYSTISITPDASIQLLRADGVALAHYPASSPAAADESYVRGMFSTPEQPQELTYRDAELDGQRQLLTLRKVANYPLVIAAAQPMSSVLHLWKQQEASSTARTLALAILAGLLLAGFRVALQRHDRLEVERRRLEHELKDKQKAQALGLLAASMAHDFNNVLSAIVGHAEIARTLVDANPRAAASVDRVLTASERARDLVRRVLSFDPHHSVSHAPIAIEPVVAEVLELIRASLPSTISLGVAEFAPHGMILGDATEVHQVVMNLCTNAIHAMPDGGRLDVQIDTLEVQQPRDLTLGHLYPGHWLRLAVIDTGMGLAANRLRSIFEPFHTTQPTGQGTGIGLTVVSNIVNRMGGAIQVESRVGSGTRMSVYWPLIDASTAATQAHTAAAPGRGQAVLIVDDEPELVQLAEETVAALGYEAIGFVDARAALEAFTRSPERFDAVLTDQCMPALPGTSLAGAIRRLRAQVPIILVTGCRNLQTESLARQAGITQILEKPLRVKDLQMALSHALSPAA